jgi:hypothetical protein
MNNKNRLGRGLEQRGQGWEQNQDWFDLVFSPQSDVCLAFPLSH